MKYKNRSSRLPLLATFMAASCLVQAQLVINELDCDQAGTDSAEFIELYDGGTGNTSLDGYVLVLINGSDDLSYASYDLDTFATDANGFFVLNLPSNGLQNGADAVALYIGDAVDFPNDTDPTTVNLVDAIAYDTNDSDDTGLLTKLGLTVQYDEAGGGDQNTHSISRLPDGGAIIAAVTASPGAPNPTLGGVLGISLDVTSISEDGTSFITGTVSAPSPVAGDVTVTVTLSDGSEAVTTDTTILATETDGTFIIDAVDDFWPDGDQTVTVTVEAPTYDPASTTFTITDDDLAYTVIINEVYNHVDGIPFDANNDGTADDTDEFVEVLNVSAGPLDLSGATLSDGSFVRHIFPNGTILEPGCAVLVFAGGDVQEGSVQFEFGDTPVQIADSGTIFPGLSFDGDGDTVILRDATGNLTGSFDAEIHSVALPDQSAAISPSSITTTADGDASSSYILHTATIEGTEMSPGTTPAGGSYCALTNSVTVSIAPGTYTESDGSVSMAGTVSIPASIATDLVVYIDSSDPSEVDTSFVSPVTILSGSTSASFDLDLVDDAQQDGTQTVTLTGRAIGYFNGTTTVDVEDDGDAPVFTDLIINEFDADQPGGDTMEFIELFNNTSEIQSLNGLVLVLFNGSGDIIYNAIDLSGLSIEANGYFVIGNAIVPNVDLVLGSNGLQNGVDAFAIFAGSLSDYSSGTSVTGLPGTLVDAVVYNGTDAVLQAALDPAGVSVSESGAADSASARPTDGGSAFSSASFVTQTPTPGETNVLPLNDFTSWASSQTPPVSTLEGADEDGDGIVNLLEYALGLDPNSPNGSPGTFVGGDLSFSKGAEAVANGDVTWSIEVSDDLGVTDPWEAVTPDVDDASTISYTLPSGSTKLFARLNVSPVVILVE